MNNKGLTYVEVLCALGIGAMITAATVGAVQAGKDKAVEMTEEHVKVYESIDNGTYEEEIENIVNQGGIKDGSYR